MNTAAVPPPHNHHSSTYNTTRTTPSTPASTSATVLGTSVSKGTSISPRVSTKEPSEPEISLHCQSLREVQLELEKLIKKQQHALIPEPVWCQFMLHTGATFSIESDNGGGGGDSTSGGSNGVTGNDGSGSGSLNGGELDTAQRKASGADTKPSRTAISLTEVLDVSKEDKRRHEVQIAVSRAIVTALEEIDEFRYTRRNSWETKARDGLRLSYVCSESLQNHDRSANKLRKKSLAATDSSVVSSGDNGNGAVNDEPQVVEKSDAANGAIQQANTATVASGQSMEKHQHGKPLPTYDCRGTVMVKFLALQQCAVIIYRHNPIHRPVSRKTTEEGLMATGRATGSGTAAVEKQPKRKRTKKTNGSTEKQKKTKTPKDSAKPANRKPTVKDRRKTDDDVHLVLAPA